MKKYMVSSKLLMKIRDCSRYVLTSLVGDWEGPLVGLSVSILGSEGSIEGSTDGDLLGLVEGDELGLDVGFACVYEIYIYIYRRLRLANGTV